MAKFSAANYHGFVYSCCLRIGIIDTELLKPTNPGTMGALRNKKLRLQVSREKIVKDFK
jgi:hypothetical protein